VLARNARRSDSDSIYLIEVMRQLMLMTTVSCLGQRSGVVPKEHWTSLPAKDNSVLHYLYNMAVGLVYYSKARAFKAKAKKLGLKAKAKD